MSEPNALDDRFCDDPPFADEDVAKLRLQLRDFSLSELEEEGLVRWNRGKNVVIKGPQFDEKRPEWRIE